MKVTKRLVKAIVCLIASVVLCIGVCLAWFVASHEVDGRGMKPAARGVNIDKFELKIYQLNKGDTDNKYTVGALKTDRVLATYGALVAGENAATAVLLDFEYTFKVNNDGKDYNISATGAPFDAETNKQSIAKDSTSTDNFVCNLSDAASFWRATVSGGVVTDGAEVTAGTELPFIDRSVTGTETKNSEIILNASPISDSANGHMYLVFDYSVTSISQLYVMALDLGGTLNSTMTFTGDIDFVMQETA